MEAFFESNLNISAVYLIVAGLEAFASMAVVSVLVHWIVKKKLSGFRDWEWPERNRVMFSLNNFVIGALFAAVIIQLLFAHLRIDDLRIFYIQFALVMLCGTFWLHWIFKRIYFLTDQKQKSIGRQIRAALSVPLLFLPYIITGAIGIRFYFADSVDLPTKVVVVFLVSFVTYIVAFGGHIKIMRFLRIMKPASQRIQNIVEGLSKSSGLDVRSSYIFAFPGANAVAFPLNRVLAISEDAIDSLNDGEIRAILAHELGHLAESPSTVFKRMLSAFVFPIFFVAILAYEMFANVAPPWYGMVIVGYFILTVVGLIRGKDFDHRQEFASDEMGVKLSSRDAFGHALEKVHKLSFLPVSFGRKQSHPDLKDRLEKIGYEVKFKDVGSPPSFNWHLAGVVTVFVAAIILFKAAPIYIASSSGQVTLAAKVLMATQGPTGSNYYGIAQKILVDSPEKAVGYLKKADVVGGPKLKPYSFQAISELVKVGECNQANKVYDILHQDQKHVKKLINHNRAENQKIYLNMIESLENCVED